MTLKDFAAKEADIAREQGAATAVKQGFSEVAMKALLPYAKWRATPIWAAEWDVCLVLDSCRIDVFREVVMERGDLSWSGYLDPVNSKWSVGSASVEWIAETFSDRYSDEWRNAGYVTANPFSGKTGDEPSVKGDAYPLKNRGLAYLDEPWRDRWETEDGLPTVAPRDVTNRAMWAWRQRERYDMDQLVVHYMQPHIPFRSRPEWTAGWDLEGFGTGGGLGDKDDWHKVRDGEIPEDEFWDAYRDNLEWVLDEVARWQRQTDARILVTSDHGNGLGELGVWGHPPWNGNPAVRRVPWAFIDGNGSGPPDLEPPGDPPVVGGTTEEKLAAQLKALGYK